MSWLRPTGPIGVGYARQTTQSPNPLVRFAHRQRVGRSLAMADSLLPSGGALLDFGAGEGVFLDAMAVRRPDARLLAVEPYQQIPAAGRVLLDRLWDAVPRSIDLITALEVLEHLDRDGLRDFNLAAARALRPGGRIFVTVPIMYGLALPLKEVSRILMRRRFDAISPGDLVRATLGRPIPRSPNLRGSHKGFDFRQLTDHLRGTFKLGRSGWSPFPALPWWCNSQAMLVGTLPA